MVARPPCFRRCAIINATSPNHEGVEGIDRAVVWMITDPSARPFIWASLMEDVWFFLVKEAHCYPCSLQGTSRRASPGLCLAFCWCSHGLRFAPLLLLAASRGWARADRRSLPLI